MGGCADIVWHDVIDWHESLYTNMVPSHMKQQQ